MPKSIITDPLALENQFCFALYSASLAMTKTYKPFRAQLSTIRNDLNRTNTNG